MSASLSFYARNLASLFTLSSVVAGLMTALSLDWLFFAIATYPNVNSRLSFIANDMVNLVIGLTALLSALWLLRRAKLPGLLGVPVALFYVTYNTIAYTAATPLIWPFPSTWVR